MATKKDPVKRTISIHGKEYLPVSERVNDFRKAHPLPDGSLCIRTEMVHADDGTVIMRAEIADLEGRVLATGYAEESRTRSGISASTPTRPGGSSSPGMPPALPLTLAPNVTAPSGISLNRPAPGKPSYQSRSRLSL